MKKIFLLMLCLAATTSTIVAISITYEIATLASTIAVIQEGSNYSYVVQDHTVGASTFVEQSGMGNTSIVEQIYNSSNVEHHQGVSGSAIGNRAYTLQGPGVGSSTRVYQNYAFSESEVKQEGDYNSIIVTQSFVDYSSIDQSGYLNEVSVNQQSAGLFPANFSEAYQFGEHNIVQVDQVDQSISYIDQNGTDNIANVYQDTRNGTYSLIDQYGDNNYADLEQIRIDYSESIIAQYGTANQTIVYQHDGIGLQSLIEQNGTGNTALVLETGMNNYSEVSQIGTSNFCTVDISEYNNSSVVSQMGTGNYVYVKIP